MGRPLERCALAGLLLVACVAPARPAGRSVPAAAPARAEGPSALHYTVRIDAALRALDVQLCFEGNPPPELVSGEPAVAGALRSAWIERGEQREPLVIGDDTIATRSAPRDGCVGYALDLAAMEGWRGGGMAVARRQDALLTNIAAWLWRPIRWDRVQRADARFELPAGTAVEVPWPREGERYRLEPSAFAFYGGAVFGRFERKELKLPTGTLVLAILPGLPDAVRSDLEPWLNTAAHTASLITGRLADPRVMVAVLPTGPSDEPVQFGMATRGGGSGLLLLVPSNAELDALRRDWVAVHELCHLYHPFVARDQAWLSEGLATYYQEVLRVRAGLQPASAAWQRFYEGSLRGRGSRRSLAEASAKVKIEHDYPTIYWAGAAFALMADVALRERSGGKRSLDDVVAGLSSCCARSPVPMRVEALLPRMDEIAGIPVFTELAAKWVNGPTMPELEPLFARLGLRVDGERVRETAGGEQEWIRAAIMKPRLP